ncbi:aldose epimerase family protein [Flavobacterium sp. Fl-77]|uniref:Aldose 1-epimerase n=1 Tax=Flavobacterium flavipigmentatum TaxID=2893884 RepID=A0AAJ2SEI6_9FLAO|nr:MULTISPECIES: aldose epimerase family protein [unclassified Flavobacterium]MDX6181072.1 aldose epimerase family protein [Flavobacterium sp. Fl-33]MDX6184673.1 aldose epimerase family protein [Flavobacterium sp. Fl-77]UFH39775.1 galactose mutarotase [Flavobacterium sp. F-70]
MNVLKRYILRISLLSLAIISVQCKSDKKMDNTTISSDKKTTVTIEKSSYGTTSKGEKIESYKLKNQNGMEVDIITFGGIITDLKVPNKEGISENVVIGFNSLQQYEKENPFFGALIGRFGNRIAKGKFSLDGKEYSLAINNAPNALHGGPEGFHRVVWKAVEAKSGATASLKLSYLAKDGEEGYPGNLQVFVTYTLNNNNELQVHYEATTDKKTVVNLTQHSYFNLSADFSKTILDHEITLNADKIVPVDVTLIPTGKLEDVANTPFDFRKPKLVGKEIGFKNEQLERGKGYDHCWVLNNSTKGKTVIAKAYHAASGRILEVTTDEPGIQFYSGNFLDGTLPMRNQGTYAYRTGFCLETQHFPDAPNQKDFPTTVLNPGEKYNTTTTFKFSVKK